MTKPKMSSRKELEFDFAEVRNTNLSNARRSAALERVWAHIIALEANNAAFIKLITPDVGEECMGCDWIHSHSPSCIVAPVLANPHPGVALLEDHSKALVKAEDEGHTRGIAEAMEVCRKNERRELMPILADLLPEDS